MRKLFGTDGIRGKANIYPMDALTAYKVGAAVGQYFNKADHKPKVLIGRDTRISGTMLESALLAGLCAVGCNATPLGVISTPGVAYLTQTSDADAGVVISASHNPYIDNGIKIFSKSGFKLPDAVELEIEKFILDDKIEDFNVEPHLVGSASTWPDGRARYVDALIATMGGIDLKGLKIIIDGANGAAFKIAPDVFTKLGANLTAIGIDPDGRNINKARGSLHTGHLKKMVVEEQADLGIAFDGDADRAIFVDARGVEVDGDIIMAICAKHLKQKELLKKNTLVATVMSNLGLDRAMEGLGIDVIKTAVGDRYVVEEMRAKGFNFGGEQSGHLIFLDHSTSGDGVLTALQVLKTMAETQVSFEELSSVMTRYPQVLKNLVVTYKRPLEELNETKALIAQIEEKLGKEGRILVRYSGTENKVRVMIEGQDIKEIDGYVNEIIQSLDAELN